jgi:hypothetical protein
MKSPATKSVLALVLAIALAATPAAAPPPEDWNEGDEFALTGHRFTEEYWTADIVNTTPDGAEVRFSMSYVDHDDAQAFLLAFRNHTKNGHVSTLPYQLFGLHFNTRGTGAQNREVFIGAVLAFLMAFNDTWNGTAPGENGMPDPAHEDVYYVLPFGVTTSFNNTSYVPTVSPIPAQKLGEGHYRFGMRYENLYAKVISGTNPIALLLSAAFPLYIAKFSELTITYDITYDAIARTIRAETFYTLGQVTRLWLFGVPVDPHLLPDNFGVAAVHYLVTFASTYPVTGKTSGHSIDTGIQQPVDEPLNLMVGTPPRPALEVGFRGTFDLVDEMSGAYVRRNDTAYNAIVAARPGDALLVAWQAEFSKSVMATLAYALSDEIQSRYDGPLDLYRNGSADFMAAAMWYAVSFPRWDGYRVEHDPVYTGFLPPAPTTPTLGPLGGVIALVALVAVVAVIAVAATRRRQPAPQAPPGYPPPR